MSVLDVFEILFKTNSKQAVSELNEVDNKIADLAKKGSKRSEQEEKELKELRKQRTGLTQDLRDQGKATNDLATSLTEVGLQAVAAFATFEGLKAGITNAAEFNAQLSKTAQVTGESEDELAAYDRTFAHFGANTGEFADAFSRIAHQVLLVGGNVKDIIPNIRELGKEMNALEKAQPGKAGQDAARSLFERRNAQFGGALSPGLEYGLLNNPQDFDKELEQQKKLGNISKEAGDSARELEGAWKDVGTELTSAFTPFIPVLLWVTDSLKAILRLLRMVGDLVSGNFSDIGNSLEAIDDDFKKKKDKIHKEDNSILQWLGLAPKDDAGKSNFSNSNVDTSKSPSQILGGSDEVNKTINKASSVTGKSSQTGPSADPDQEMKDYQEVVRKMSAADQSPINSAISNKSSQNNININSITVHTQATDAKDIAGNIGQSLKEQLAFLANNANDGIMA